MEYKILADTGLKVSPLCLGTLSFGGIASDEESRKMFGTCCDLGINFYDTADVYNNGRSEELLGEYIKGSREKFVIASKVYFPTGRDINERGVSRKHIFHAVDASLKRLQTDYLEWRGKSSQFVTDSFVTITRENGDTLQGTGMITDVALNYVTVKNNVRGSMEAE